MNLVTAGLLTAALAGATQLVKHVFPTLVSGWVTVVIVLALGLIAGFAGIEGLTPLTGILTAFAACGTVTVASKIGS